MNDPMLSADAEEREKYSAGIMDTMKQAIEEDRAARRKPTKQDSPAVIIGATGIPGGLNQSL